MNLKAKLFIKRCDITPRPGVQAEMWTWQSMIMRFLFAEDGLVSLVSSVDRRRRARLVPLRLEGVGDDLPGRFDRIDLPNRHRLHEHIADRGCFDRPGDDFAAASVGGELVEQLAARAAADDVDAANLSAKDFFEAFKRAAIGEGETLEADAHELAARRRR